VAVDHLTHSVSVVIPAHNEARTIAGVVRDCARHTPGLVEVLVVDDGSTDGTAAVAEAAGARVLRLERNQGKGIAIRRGVAAARGDVLVFIDADGQDDPSEIAGLLAAFEPDVALVLGSRFLGRFRPGAITRLNYLGTRFIRASVNLLFGTSVTDPLAGFRAVRASAFERIELRARGYDIEVDLLLQVLAGGGRVAEAPAERSQRPYGKSGLSSFRDGSRIMLRILQIRLQTLRRPAGGPARGGVPSGGLAERAQALAQAQVLAVVDGHVDDRRAIDLEGTQ
jgi:glycosyltransferase involved in cell wall biosynthesis